MLLSLSNVLEKAVVCRVIAILGEQKADMQKLFYRQHSGLTTGGFVSGEHGLPLKSMSSLLSMLVDLLYRLGKLADVSEVRKKRQQVGAYFVSTFRAHVFHVLASVLFLNITVK